MSVLIPVGVFDEVGLYDAEHFPMSWGDADLVLRAREAGWRLVYEGRSLVWNDQEQTEMAIPRMPEAGEIVKLLRDVKSRFRVVPAVRFWVRHVPPREIPGVAYDFYAPVGRAVRRRWLRPVKLQAQRLLGRDGQADRERTPR
jgi:hypothetical protein